MKSAIPTADRQVGQSTFFYSVQRPDGNHSENKWVLLLVYS